MTKPTLEPGEWLANGETVPRKIFTVPEGLELVVIGTWPEWYKSNNERLLAQSEFSVSLDPQKKHSPESPKEAISLHRSD